MIWRRLLVALAVASTVAGVVWMNATGSATRVDPSFSVLLKPTMPFAPQFSSVTSSWFCPGVPTAGDGVGGTVTVINPSDAARTGRVTVFTDQATTAPVEQRFTVDVRGSATFDLKALQPTGTFASALVEMDGGGGIVEQTALHPAGNAIAPCTNSASSAWYFADGFTVAQSTGRIIITNPYPDDAVVTVEFATATEKLTPAALEALPIPGRSIKVLTEELMPKKESILATKVTSSRGRIVVSRAQQYLGEGRLGYTLGLGAPSLGSQFYFADGEKGQGITERYSVYNGSDQDVQVEVIPLGLQDQSVIVEIEPLLIPPGEVRSLVTSDIADLPDGRHGFVFTTVSDSIVVERALTRPAGDSVATSVVMGLPGEFESITRRWTVATGVDQPLENALVVMSIDGVDGTLSVNALAAGGVAPIPGLENVVVPAGQIVMIPITDATAVNVPLIIESTGRIFVERLFARGGDLRGRSGSFALPG